MTSHSVIIVAGGTGARMKSSIPKQFILLGGIPVLMHTIRAFYLFDKKIEIVVVLPNGLLVKWKQLCKKHGFDIPYELAKGGKNRFHSVKNALTVIRSNGLIAIHDGVRPLVSKSTISNVFREAEQHGNAVPAIPVPDSVRWVTTGLNEPFDRNQLRIIQTPQVFKVPEIRQAYAMAKSDDFTDDATVLESMGIRIHLTEGSRENIKITYPPDLALAEILLKKIR